MSRYGLDILAAERRKKAAEEAKERGGDSHQASGSSSSSRRLERDDDPHRQPRNTTEKRHRNGEDEDDDESHRHRDLKRARDDAEGHKDRAYRPRPNDRPPSSPHPSSDSFARPAPRDPQQQRHFEGRGGGVPFRNDKAHREWEIPATTPQHRSAAPTPKLEEGRSQTHTSAAMTPGPSRVGSSMAPPTPRGSRNAQSQARGMKYSEWEDDKVARAWYDNDEEGGIALGNPEGGDNGKFIGSEELFQRREQALKRSIQTQSARAQRMQADNNTWEESRMVSAGVAVRDEVSMELETMEDVRMHIIVHKVTPPFLDATIDITRERETVAPVKDPTSDMVQLARKGSELLKRLRMQREREKGTKDRMKMAHTMMGKILKVKEDDQDDVEKINAELARAHAPDAASPTVPENPEASPFTRNRTLQQQRESLPVYKCKEELLQLVRENQVLIIVGETGCGKTTQVTQFLNEAGYARGGLRIGCTQPRRVAAMSVAKRVSEEFGCALGDEVGYCIRFEDVTSEKTIIRYMTDGVLLRESLKDPDLESYSCIVMDEAHERSLNTDVLFGILKQVVARRHDLKLLVTSATMDATKFSAFFGNVPIFYIKGRTYPVEVLYTKTPVLDYVDAAVKQAATIHVGGEPGDILIFMTGQEDIECTCYALQERMKEVSKETAETLHVLPIYSLLPSELQAKIFERTANGHRKVIVATNIAETSLTVDGIFYVIDTGFAKLKVYNSKIGMDALQVYPESQAAANQRKGRAGRTGPGKCFRLFTEVQYKNEMLENTVPEMQRTNLSNVVLLLKSLGVENLMEFEFMDPPPKDNLQQSLLQLWMLGALDSAGGMTDTGRKMVEFPVDPSLSKCLIVASEPQYHCSKEVLTIVSMLSIPQVFIRPKEREGESDSIREKFFVAESDHLSLLSVHRQWQMNGRSKRWCDEHFINFKGMQRVDEILGQLQDIYPQTKMRVLSCGDDWDPVRKCLASGFFHHSARRKGIGEYVTMLTGIPCALHPSSALYGLGTVPDYVIYHELVMTTREFMNTVTSVEPEWLPEVAGRFFSVKEGHKARLQGQRRVKEEMEAMEREATSLRQQTQTPGGGNRFVPGVARTPRMSTGSGGGAPPTPMSSSTSSAAESEAVTIPALLAPMPRQRIATPGSGASFGRPVTPSIISRPRTPHL